MHLNKQKTMNQDVTLFLDNLNHPFRQQIELLRKIILTAAPAIEENIKWNGPNYTLEGHDRITIRVNPPKSFSLILHRGAKVQAAPASRLIEKDHGVLVWKTNDRAVADFKKAEDFEKVSKHLHSIIQDWIAATNI